VASKVRLTVLARRDLGDIGRFIGRDNRQRAASFIHEIHQKAGAYADHPDMGRDRADLAAGIRSFPHGDYAVFYRRFRTGIQIVRVISGYRDISPDMLATPPSRKR
jgi:toxin ParE1/3/4